MLKLEKPRVLVYLLSGLAPKNHTEKEGTIKKKKLKIEYVLFSFLNY